MISNYKCTFGLKEGKSTSVTQKQMPSHRPQYRDTVHLFIGTGRSSWKFTIMPFTFINNSMITLWGLIWFFIFKSVSFSAATPKLFYTQLRHCANLCASSYRGSDPSSKVPVNVLYSRNIVKSCFWGPSEAEGPQQVPHRTVRCTPDRYCSLSGAPPGAGWQPSSGISLLIPSGFFCSWVLDFYASFYVFFWGVASSLPRSNPHRIL
jgi:hypothetical protein